MKTIIQLRLLACELLLLMVIFIAPKDDDEAKELLKLIKQWCHMDFYKEVN